MQNPRLSLCRLLTLAGTFSASVVFGQPTFQPIAFNGEQAPGFDPGVTLSSFSSNTLAVSDNGNAVFRAFASGQGDVLFHVSPSGDVQPYVLEDTQAPGLPAGVNLSAIVLPRAIVNDSGEVVFTGLLNGTGVTGSTNQAIFAGSGSDLRVVSREGDAVPGLPSHIYRTLFRDYTQFNNAGHATFWCQIQGPGTDEVIVSEGDGQGPRTVVTRYEQVPGMPAGTTYKYFLGNTLNIDDSGRTSFVSGIDSASGEIAYAVLREDASGVPGVVAIEGEHALGLPSNTEFYEIGVFSPKANTAGEYALVASIRETIAGSLSRDIVCVLRNEGDVDIVAHEGDPAPGLPQGVTYGSFQDGATLFALSNSGRVAFVARIDGPGVDLDNRYAIFAETGESGPVLIARNNDQAPGHPAGTHFESVTSSRVRFNDSNQLAFITTLSDGTETFKGLYATDEFGVLHHVVSEGDTIDLDPDPEQTNLVTITRLDNLELANTGEILIAVVTSESRGLIKYSGVIPCLPDTNHDGTLSPADFSAWVAAFNASAPECDQNGDSSCSPADFSAWVANYNAGC